MLTIRKLLYGENDYYGWKSRPDSAGGVDVAIGFTNDSEKTIKYIYFHISAYNTVGDPAMCEIHDTNKFELKLTGPIDADGSGVWEDLFYNHATSKIAIDSIDIEYMDGSIEKQTDNFDIVPIPSSEGCYVATCVYGSYDCPEVWTLRRYRDSKLATTWYGRGFIYTYYAISPTIVKIFGNTKWFKSILQKKLDRMVINLQKEAL